MPSSKALELAQASATVYQNYTDQLAEVGDALSVELLSNAASAAAETDRDYAERHVNAGIIRHFRELLPLQDRLGFHFRTPDPLMWHKIKSTVIYNGWDPEYQIGIRSGKEQSDSIMLISALHHRESVPTKRGINPKVGSALNLLTQSMLGTSPTQSELETAYDPKKKEYVLGNDSPGVIQTVGRWESASVFPYVEFMNNALIGGVCNSGLIRVPRVLKHREVCMWGDKKLFNRFDEVGPNDRDMAEYGVFSQLGALAARFGFTEKYQEILEEAKKGSEIEPQGDAAHHTAIHDPTLYRGDNLR